MQLRQAFDTAKLTAEELEDKFSKEEGGAWLRQNPPFLYYCGGPRRQLRRTKRHRYDMLTLYVGPYRLALPPWPTRASSIGMTLCLSMVVV